MKSLLKICFVAALPSLLGGCAVGNMLASGYTPPPALGGMQGANGSGTNSLPNQSSKRGLGAITLDSYKGDSAYEGQADSAMSAPPDGDYVQPWSQPSTVFSPSFSHKSLSDYAAQLSMQLVNNSNGIKRQDLIGVTSFVALDRSLQNTNILGNQLAEYFISEIQQFGLSVVDFKMTNGVSVTERGDFVFSRDSMALAKNMKMDHVLSGTMIEKPKGVQINARIISLKNHRVMASASVLVPHYIAERLAPSYISSVSH